MDILKLKEYKAWYIANDRFEHWLNKDDSAMGLIQNAVKCTQCKLIVSAKTSMQMWEQLKKDYIKLQSGTNIHFYYQQLYTKQWDGTSLISNHVGFYLSICHQFIEAGYKPDNYTTTNAILLSLPHTPTWEVMKSNLLYHGPMLTLEAVSAELMSIYEQVTHEDSAASISKGDNNLSGSKPDFKSTKGKMKKR